MTELDYQTKVEYSEVGEELKSQNVVLISPPTRTHRTPEEHLGIETLAAEAECLGHNVKILDSWIEGLNNTETVEEILRLNEEKPLNVVGLSPSMDSDQNTIEISKGLRKRGYSGIIVVGGFNATFEQERFLDESTGVDLLFRGEADISFPYFLNQLSRGLNWQDTSGIVYRDNNGDLIQNKNPEIVTQLDSIPFPKRPYLEIMNKKKIPAHVSDSRGCWNRCAFCIIGAFHDSVETPERWRGRSPKNIIEELEILQDRGVTHVKFLGDTFFSGKHWKERVLNICKEMDKHDINLKFRLSTRVDTVDNKTFQILKEHGLFAVSLGAESGVQRKLEDWGKGTTVEQNLKAISILQELDIYVQMGFILIDPWVTVPELEQELEFLKKTRWVVTKGICTTLFAPVGTRITERIKEEVPRIEKRGSNYVYKVLDPQAERIHSALKLWSLAHTKLYDMTIDPISAPKSLSDELYRDFHEVCSILKNRDISIFQELLSLSEDVEIDLDKYVHKRLKETAKETAEIKREVEELYTRAGLPYNSNINKYIY